MLGAVACVAKPSEPTVLPESPPVSPSDTIESIEEFLVAGGTVDQLTQWVGEHAYPADNNAVTVLSENLDNDTVDEVIVAAQYCADDVDGCAERAFLAIFDDSHSSYELTSIALDKDPLSGIYTIKDINANGVPDIVFVWGFCGVSICTHHIQIIEWADGVYVERITEDISMSQVGISLVDPDGDGTWDIVLETPGTVSSLSIGPRFEERIQLAWNGSAYIVIEHSIGPCRVLCSLLNE